MGRASNRKKAQRRAGPSSRQARQTSQAGAATQQRTNQLADGLNLNMLVQIAKERVERQAAARPAWRGGAEPVSAETPQWPEGSLGHRFRAGMYLAEVQDAPCLLTAEVPAAATIVADPAQTNIATSALIRAVVFDDLALDHPAVSMLLEALAPVAEDELAYYRTAEGRDRAEPVVPLLDGPVYLLGGRALVDAVWAAVGEDPLSGILGVLVPALDDTIPGLDGQVAADALIGAVAAHYRYDRPGDAEVLERIRCPGGNALESLVAAGTVPAADVLPAGLTLLSALARLCQSDSASLLQRTA